MHTAACQHQLESLLGEKVGQQPKVLRLVVDDQQGGTAQLSG